jgi:hypothetical protein
MDKEKLHACFKDVVPKNEAELDHLIHNLRLQKHPYMNYLLRAFRALVDPNKTYYNPEVAQKDGKNIMIQEIFGPLNLPDLQATLLFSSSTPFTHEDRVDLTTDTALEIYFHPIKDILQDGFGVYNFSAAFQALDKPGSLWDSSHKVTEAVEYAGSHNFSSKQRALHSRWLTLTGRELYKNMTIVQHGITRIFSAQLLGNTVVLDNSLRFNARLVR